MLAIDFPVYARIREWLDAATPAILVEVAAADGSTPREQGAVMAVTESDFAGTIGGGQLEWLAQAQAREMIGNNEASRESVISLGPSIGQCCGGRVRLRLTRIGAELAEDLRQAAMKTEENRPYVFIFGAGHTGKALSDALGRLPFHVSLVDSRPSVFEHLETGAAQVLTPLPEEIVDRAPAGSAFVTMTHEHSLDFLITGQALRRGDAAYVGMIGSRTKRAVFLNWLADNGYGRELGERLVCPIGGSHIRDKRPEIIAALATAEIVSALLQDYNFIPSRKTTLPAERGAGSVGAG